MTKRFFYFLFGFTIGAIFIYLLLLKGRSFDFWMPGERVKAEIIGKKPMLSDKSNCEFDCLSLNKDSISAIIESSKVNFKESKVHEKPCKIYILESNLEKIRMEFSLCDSTAILNSIIKEGKECNCEL